MAADDEASDPIELPDAELVGSSDGVQVAVYDLGGDGPDVLLVHATGFCAGVWTPLAAHLGGMRRVALDVRGHGRSGVPEDMDWNGTARDVLAAGDSLDLRRPFGVGHSMGGASLVLAELARPGTFSGLWLYEPIIFPPALAGPDGGDGGSNPLAQGARRRREVFASAEEAFANFSSKPPLRALSPDALWAYVRHGFEELPDGSVRLRCAPEVEARTYEMGPRHHAFERLGDVECPVTVLRGSAEVPGPASIAPLVATELRRATLEEHPELGHFGPLEDPAAMAASIRSSVTAGS